MRKKFVFHVAFFLVTRAFTICLIWLIIAVASLFAKADSVHGDSNGVTVKVRSNCNIPEIKFIAEENGIAKPVKEVVLDKNGDTVGYREYNKQGLDTIKSFTGSSKNYLNDPVFNLPAGLFNKSGFVYAFFWQARLILLVLAWLFILYQVYLILDDLKKDIYFAEDNARRIRKIGYWFLVLFLLNLVRFEYNAYLFPDGGLLMDEKRSSMKLFSGDSFFYLSVGTLILVLSMVFTAGTKIEEENKLTV